MTIGETTTSRKYRLRPRPILFLVWSALLLVTFYSSQVAAQDDDEIDAPPPLKIIPKNDSSQLSAESDAKDRTRLSLTLMDSHVATVERLATGHEFDLAIRELGSFEALMDDSVGYLEQKDSSKGRTLDAFKRLEMGLRSFMPRIETVRRLLPLRFDTYVRRLMKGLRDARAKAVDPMF
ncbi:MAG TPA: hypothetical protein VGO43_06140, partial [Pyrinomonadaceae bacterium]|nr:hypothetical protein [Pyrinomonadaceae bacterium]